MSPTVTLNVLLALLLCESVALHVTVVCPMAKVAPEAGVAARSGDRVVGIGRAERVTDCRAS